MPNCPNCGRDTKRTGDWACQWCGYPLPSGSYKVIPKTYAQVKEERLRQAKIGAGLIAEAEPEVGAQPKQDLEVIRAIKIESGTEKEAPPQPEIEVEPEEEAGAEAIEEAEEGEPEPEPERELEPPEIELTVEELLSAYAADDVAADERFMNKVIRLTGVVAAVDVKDVLDRNSIRLTGGDGDPWQSVQCMFTKKHSAVLAQLEMGQRVTVQGRYSGSLIAMRMVDCVLV